jgi:hypothetical protein
VGRYNTLDEVAAGKGPVYIEAGKANVVAIQWKTKANSDFAFDGAYGTFAVKDRYLHLYDWGDTFWIRFSFTGQPGYKQLILADVQTYSDYEEFNGEDEPEIYRNSLTFASPPKARLWPRYIND